jgi:hypothetical protein
MDSKILIGLLTVLLNLLPGLNSAIAAENLASGAIQYAQAGVAGKDETGRVLTKAGHVQEAWKHTEAALRAGDQGDVKGVGEHARTAKVHVESALAQSTIDEHLIAARKSLDSAIEHSNMGHADMARKAAEEALNHLNAAK